MTMKTATIILIFLAFLLAGLSVGQNEPNQAPCTTKEGEIVASGTWVPEAKDCNSCLCEDGRFNMCTELWCPETTTLTPTTQGPPLPQS